MTTQKEASLTEASSKLVLYMSILQEAYLSEWLVNLESLNAAQ